MAKVDYWLEAFETSGGIPLNPDAQPPPSLNAKYRVGRATDELIGLLKGVLADGTVNTPECDFLRQWCTNNPDVIQTFPGRDVYLRIERAFADGNVTDEDRSDLQELFERITGIKTEAPVAKGNASTRAFFDDPEPPVLFAGRAFSFTGKFIAGTRAWCVERVITLGATFHDKPISSTDFLVIGTLS